jgi:hypothetical protein
MYETQLNDIRGGGEFGPAAEKVAESRRSKEPYGLLSSSSHILEAADNRGNLPKMAAQNSGRLLLLSPWHGSFSRQQVFWGRSGGFHSRLA